MTEIRRAPEPAEEYQVDESRTVIALPPFCPGKSGSRTIGEGFGGLGVLDEVGLGAAGGEDPLEGLGMARRCSKSCDGPIEEPRKFMGVTIGKRLVCPRGNQPRRGIVLGSSVARGFSSQKEN